MARHFRGYPRSGSVNGNENLIDLSAFEAALRDAPHGAADEAASLGQGDQLARDLAEIERATAALRRAEPALETWNETARDDLRDVAAAAMGKPRPLWLLIGLLWLSTALVTVGAVAAIRVLTG